MSIPPATLLDAYASGWFPMATGRDAAARIEWFSPDPRGVLPLRDARFSARLLRTIRQHRFDVRCDTAFVDVMRACGARRDDTWINDAIIDSYTALHRLGFAHSVECWRDGTLVGGLYGVSLRGAFFGESMFHTETDASKVALHALVTRLNGRGYHLLDVQYVTPHLATFGAIAVARRRYLRMLSQAMQHDCTFG